MRRRRPGRPRKQAGRRTASGAVARQDRVKPTFELLRHRQALVGPQADPCLAENPLGVLLAHGLISAEEQMAGQRFAWLYRLTVGRQTVRSSDPLMPREEAGPAAATPPLGPGQAAWLAARQADLARARQDLLARGPRVYEMVQRYAIAQQHADWMGCRRPLTKREAEALSQVQEGLTCLAHSFGLTAGSRGQIEREHCAEG